MIPLYRIDHVSQVVPDLQRQASLLAGLFGFKPVRAWNSERDGCRGMMLELGNSRSQRWELLEPTGTGSELQAFLESPHGPGLHHIAVETNDIDGALAELERLGVHPPNRRSGSDCFDVPIAQPVGGVSSPADGLVLRLFGAPAASICGDDRRRRSTSVELRSDEPRQNTADQRLGIRELAHVCQATSDLDVLAAWNEQMLGMSPIFRTPERKHPDMETMMLSVPGSQIIWELIAPAGESSFIERFLEKRGEADCHHVTFEVENWDAAVGACERYGIPIFGESSGETDGARWKDAFIHPKHTAGVLVQIYFEERPGVWMRSDKVPALRKSAWT